MAKILHKRTSTAAKVPTAADIDLGEIALNTTDGKAFIKKSDNTIVELGSNNGGGAVTSVNSKTGAVTLNTADIGETTNLYYTNARAIAAPLTGFAVGTNAALAATDTILSGFGKLQAQINAREGSIAAGSTTQYWRGDKSWQTLDKSAVGLGSVDNTADSAKPVSTAQQTALNLKANLSAPSFTGVVKTSNILFDRNGSVASGIQWYAPAYKTWVDYMGNAGVTNQGPTGDITAPTGTYVTAWARRSLIENEVGYGWTFESAGGSAATNPIVVAEIRASDGAARFAGNVAAASFSGGGVLSSNTAVITTQDWNSISTAGVYSVSEYSGANGPASYRWGTLVVTNVGGVVTQIYYPHQQESVWRQYYGGWFGWRKTVDSLNVGLQTVAVAKDLRGGNVYTQDNNGWMYTSVNGAGFYNAANGTGFTSDAGGGRITDGGGGLKNLTAHTYNGSIAGCVGYGYVWTGRQIFHQDTGAYVDHNGSSTEIRATGGNGAHITFHRVGGWAVNMGLDPDHCIAIGGHNAGTGFRRFTFNTSNGDFTAQQNVIAYSDERLKTDWEEVSEDFVERWAEIKSGTYRRIDDNMRKQVGVGAQSVQKILPDAVFVQRNGELGLNYMGTSAVASVAIAKRVLKQEAIILEQKLEINSLKEQMALVLERLSALENR